MRKIGFLPLVVALGAQVAAADGMLDPSFGKGGLVTTQFPFPPGPNGAGASSLVILPDGRAVAAGSAGDITGPDMGAARYLVSGELDTTFSGDGMVTAGCGDFGPTLGGTTALLQPDGRVVLLGTCPASQTITVARFTVNGFLDSSFGSGGQVFTSFPPDGVWTVGGILQTDGRIVAVAAGCTGPGTPCAPGSVVHLKAARYNPDGSLDPSFGRGGLLTLQLAQRFEPLDAALQPDGKLVIVGEYGPSPNFDFGLLRLLPDGALDPSFGGGGVATSDFGAREIGASVIVLADGRLVVGGIRGTSPLVDLALARYLPDGMLDTSFGVGGLATADAGADDFGSQVIQLPNGKLFVAGTVIDAGGGRDFLLSRFHPDGGLDTSFGSSGFIKTDFFGQLDSCAAVAIAGPDLILTAGSTFLGSTQKFALARYIATTPVELLAFEVE